ncbi:hypothetical protein [Maledivibacter halophilus]|uniref:Uncharacterized protein n=1 Tax=Maledivibacter halophilus TaxID=36842 RepID=A0A1T5LWL5_9FIRM|nr:hypothetical protein [Maledivibacter halophilus]SKC79968.1 hypothetical protein SAMN02194393_03400 [Maledivibacter halophilus]
MFKKPIIFVLIIVIALIQITVFAEDNADTGSGDTTGSVSDKGYYRGSEYMYKVSVFVGLSDNADKYSSLDSNFMMIGNSPIYIKPSHFTLPSNVIGTVNSKVDYLNGATLTPSVITEYITDNPPPIPITNGGNINSVKSYFGDTATLNTLINNFAEQKGISREELVSNIKFTIEGVTKKYQPNEILPIKVDGKYQNKVPWVIIYEPVTIAYLKDRQTKLAFTATEYALAQKLGYFDFKYGKDGQYIAAMTHSDLPNSIILEESWFGYPVVSALPDGVKWNEDRIINGGGWGMRMLKANGNNTIENDITYDTEYRVNTDVITSVRIYASSGRITPHDKAYIKFNANGQTTTKSVTIPGGGSQLVFIKWRTPSTPKDVEITVDVTGNSSAKIDGKTRSKTITAKVVDLEEKVPPNPTANDMKPSGYIVPQLPNKAQKSSANWGEWDCYWEPNWVFVSNGQGGGKWVDKGDWEYEYESYSISLTGEMTATPDTKAPTAVGKKMKSGYGINIEVSANMSLDTPNSHVTGVQNVLTYYPEFNYEEYLRLMEKTSGNYSAIFELKNNKYSTYNSRVHFTPLWFPDSEYRVYGQIIDLWTPDGMLSINVDDYVDIQGNVYEDWHIGPK